MKQTSEINRQLTLASRLETSLHPDYEQGDRVVAFSGWQYYVVSDGADLLIN